MRFCITAFISAFSLLIPVQYSAAQSAAMPLPDLVINDADGKAIAPIALLSTNDDNWIALNLEGVLAFLQVNIEKGRLLGEVVYFSELGCVGDAFIYPPGSPKWWDDYSQTSFAVVGPDPDLGTYRLFRTTSLIASETTPASRWKYTTDECTPVGITTDLYPAEEILPNPLEGFHGPTYANPERSFSVEGGTKLP